MTPKDPAQATATSTGLSLRLSARDRFAVVELANVGVRPLRVLDRVDAGESHFDWTVLTLVDRLGATRTLHLVADRNESARVVVDLAPGGVVMQEIDVQAWARRDANGAHPLAPGTYRLSATYSVDEQGDSWTGTLTAGPIAFPVE